MGIRQGSGSVFGSAMLVAGTTVGAGAAQCDLGIMLDRVDGE